LFLSYADANRGFDLPAPRLTYLPPPASRLTSDGEQQAPVECSAMPLEDGGECVVEGLVHKCLADTDRMFEGAGDAVKSCWESGGCRSASSRLCVERLRPLGPMPILLFPVN
jgi:hypothetical protein